MRKQKWRGEFGFQHYAQVLKTCFTLLLAYNSEQTALHLQFLSFLVQVLQATMSFLQQQIPYKNYILSSCVSTAETEESIYLVQDRVKQVNDEDSDYTFCEKKSWKYKVYSCLPFCFCWIISWILFIDLFTLMCFCHGKKKTKKTNKPNQSK